MAPTPAARQYNANDNAAARMAVINGAVNMIQPIATGSLSGTNLATNTVVNVPVRNVGLIKRLIIELTATVARSASETQTRTKYGPANLCSQIVFTDLANQTRIQTAGWHLFNVSTVSPRRNKKAYGAAFTNDSPVNWASNFTVISCPSSFTTGNQTVRMFYEVPISYSDYDLRGAIWASVVNATMNLQFTLNPNFSVATATDATLAVFQSSTTDLAVISALSYTVYQEYLDQLPQTKNGPVLPLFDLGTAYLLNNTLATGIAAGQDLAVPYANFRDFMSTFIIYDNGGTLNVGTDINYLAIQSANYTNIVRYDPIFGTLLSREIANDDPPAGTYYFDHRRKPINTVQYGNMQLIMNPITVGSNSQLLVGYEALALINQVAQAGSLYNT